MADEPQDVEFRMASLDTPHLVATDPTVILARRFFPRPRPWQLVALVIILLLATYTSYTLYFAHPKAPPVAAPLARQPGLNPGAEGMTIAASATWSPANTAFAILGQDNRDDNLILIYDAPLPTHALVIRPDRVITAAFDHAFPLAVHPDDPGTSITSSRVVIEQTLWTVDSQTLLAPFAIVQYTQQEDPTPAITIEAAGIAIYPLGGGQLAAPRILLAAVGGTQAGPIEWDLQNNTLMLQPPATAGSSPALALATSYQWGTRGQLLAIPAATAGLSAPDAAVAIGQPDGGAEFSIWQPGYLIQSNTPPMPLWHTIIAALSPDSRYLAVLLFSSSLVTRQVLVALPPTRTSSGDPSELPSHDPAQTAAWASGSPLVSLAWSPDGVYLAASRLGGANADPALLLYHTADGALFETPTLSRKYPPDVYIPTPPVLAWSPDSHDLLILDLPDGVAQVVTLFSANMNTGPVSH